MALTLHLFRHAKSDWDDPRLNDYDRPLNPRGRKAAPRMGRFMKAEGIEPDLILCSTAARAQQTLLLALNELGWEREIRLDAGLYLASMEALLSALRKAPDRARSIMVLGHNPGLQDVALAICEDASGAMAQDMAFSFPTAALATFTIASDRWAGLAPGGAALSGFAVPKRLGD